RQLLPGAVRGPLRAPARDRVAPAPPRLGARGRRDRGAGLRRHRLLAGGEPAPDLQHRAHRGQPDPHLLPRQLALPRPQRSGPLPRARGDRARGGRRLAARPPPGGRRRGDRLRAGRRPHLHLLAHEHRRPLRRTRRRRLASVRPAGGAGSGRAGDRRARRLPCAERHGEQRPEPQGGHHRGARAARARRDRPLAGTAALGLRLGVLRRRLRAPHQARQDDHVALGADYGRRRAGRDRARPLPRALGRGARRAPRRRLARRGQRRGRGLLRDRPGDLGAARARPAHPVGVPRAMGYLRRLATTGAAYTASSILSKLIAVALLPLYTRHLTPGDYGAAEVMQAAVIAGSIVIRFGVIEALLRFYYLAGERRDAVVGTGFSVLAWSASAAAALCLALAAPISSALLGHEDA